MVSHHRISLRRACRLVKLRRSVHYYRSVKDPKQALRKRMHELAQVRTRYGDRRIHVLLRRERWSAVGLGTWLTFHVDVGDAAAMAARREVLRSFYAAGETSVTAGRAHR